MAGDTTIKQARDFYHQDEGGKITVDWGGLRSYKNACGYEMSNHYDLVFQDLLTALLDRGFLTPRKVGSFFVIGRDGLDVSPRAWGMSHHFTSEDEAARYACEMIVKDGKEWGLRVAKTLTDLIK